MTVTCSARARTVRMLLVALLLILVGCDAEGDPPTPAPAAMVPVLIASPMASAVAGQPGATPSPDGARAAVNDDGFLVGDGVCDARVPLGWVEDAPGTGTTGGGHAFSVFGNQLVGPDAWTTASTLLRDQANRQPDAVLSASDASVRITYANGAGLAYRARFDDVYCDLRITGGEGAVSASELELWEAVIASLQPSV